MSPNTAEALPAEPRPFRLPGHDPAQSARLLVWFSPSFPTGAFGFSHGLEWAIEAGDVVDRPTLTAWIADLIAHGGAWSDAVLAAAAFRAAGRIGSADGDHTARQAAMDALAEIAELATALQPSAERRLESGVQGDAFLKAVLTGWPGPVALAFRQRWDAPLPLPVAVGLSAREADLALEAVLTAALTGFAANMVSAALRLAPIGQSDGLRVLAALEPLVAATARRAAETDIEALGTCALRADIASMRHETQSTRLFRS